MMIRATMCGLLLGCLITIGIFQHDVRIKETVGTAFKQLFETSIKCHMRGTVESLNIWRPALVLRDVHVIPLHQDEQWEWKSERLIVSCTWWHILVYGIVDLHVVLENADIYSVYAHNVLAINSHINALLFGTSSTIPLAIKSVIYKQAHMHIADVVNDMHLYAAWYSESKQIDNHFKTIMHCADGSLVSHGIPYINALQGALSCDIVYTGKTSEYTLKADGAGVIMPLCPTPSMSNFSAVWENNHGDLHIASVDHLLNIKGLLSSDATAYLQGTFPLALCASLLKPDSAPAITGMCGFDIQSKNNDQGRCTHGVWHCNEACYGATPLGTVSGSWQSVGDEWHGLINMHALPALHVQGNWHWNNEQAELKLALQGDEPIALINHWQLKPDTATGTITYTSGGITATYATIFCNDYDDTQVKLAGTALCDQGSCSLKGQLNTYSYDASCTYNGACYNGLFTCVNGQQQPLATIAVDDKKLSGSLAISCIKEICAHVNGGQLQGEGTMQWEIADYKQTPIKISCLLDHGTVRVPHMYNAINGAQGIIEWDYQQHIIRLRDARLSLYQGEIVCNQATATYDSFFNPEFIQVPCLLHGCLLNMQKDVFALLSGHLTYTNKKGDAYLNGLVTIDHSQLKENIFSDAWVKRFFVSTGMMFPITSTDIGCDLYIKTVTPTDIKTSLLDTQATIDLHVTHTLSFPDIAGTITLGSGSLAFPYAPLYIRQGALYFLSGHGYDPVIELSAKNSIKNHALVLYATGSLSKPHIVLESWPPLTQEQIISLLLIGSYQDSLNMIMPALLMNNMRTLLFGDVQAASTAHTTFARVLEPFKRIRFVPSFTDQTGRGGLRGAIEIDVSDRVHAVIQKNFSLTEDTYFELGYLLSDEMNVRLLRDERRDMGAEVEMRWKFGS